MRNALDIRSVDSEAGIIASVIRNPELIFHSDQLKPNHFSDRQQAYLYYAISELAKLGVDKIDAYNITNILNAKESTKAQTESLPIEEIQRFIDISPVIARSTVQEYKLLVKNVLHAAFKRDVYQKLLECENMCFDSSDDDISKRVYRTLDSVMLSYSTTNDVPQYKDVVDEIWSEIKKRQTGETAGLIPFKFSTLNEYVTLEKGELVIFGAEQKQGKSMLLLNCAADLLKKNQKVLYIDTELNTRLFTCRMISHLTGIPFKQVRAGTYSEYDEPKISRAIDWIKSKTFTHIYMPLFDMESLMTTVKKVFHQSGIDVIIVDYFKGSGDGDAFSSYQALGSLVDCVKNDIAGSMNIAALGAAQATATGKLADSAKIARNASTIIMIQDKTQEEIEADGVECGNKKFFVRFNRNGAQMVDGEYIDIVFDGDRVLYEEAKKQHIPEYPY